LIICEICGAANREFDEQCRVCGQALSPVAAPAPVAAAEHAIAPQPPELAAPSPAPESTAPSPPPRPIVAAQPPPVVSSSSPQSPLDRLSAFGSAPATSVPPMYRSSLQQDVAAMDQEQAPPSPSFGQSTGRLLTTREPVQLISASDLPDRIRQIAEADAAKAEAEAQKAADEPQARTEVQRALQADAKASGPSTSWLTKSTGPLESRDPWDSATASATAPAVTPTPDLPPMPAYPTIMPTPTYIPEATGSPASDKRGLFGRAGGSSGERQPIYLSKPFLIAAIAAVVLLILVSI
jgi:hypothetical protein